MTEPPLTTTEKLSVVALYALATRQHPGETMQSLTMFTDRSNGVTPTDRAVYETLLNSRVMVRVVDVSKMQFPKVMHEVLHARGYTALPVVVSTDSDHAITGDYFTRTDALIRP